MATLIGPDVPFRLGLKVNWPQFALLVAVNAFVGGMVCGPMVVGLYLLIVSNVFGFHVGQAFSSLRIPDYKHLLRLHLTADGTLEIFPIAIRKVPRGGEAHARYHLIEGPIVIPPAPRS